MKVQHWMILGLVAVSAVACSDKDGEAYINNSQIVATDVEASNGIIHVIGGVLLP
jgi:uncharacterized surface protein with fasciclin (FAS1) repeats